MAWPGPTRHLIFQSDCYTKDSGKGSVLMTITIPISSVTTFRESALDHEDKVHGFVAQLNAGVKLPPIHVKKNVAGGYLLHDGRHRMRAHEIAGHSEIEVELIEGKAELDGIRVLRKGL